MELKEVKKLLSGYSKEDVIFGKTEAYILERIGATKKEVEDDLFTTENLEFVEEQKRSNETRYALFFIYSRKSGRVYVVKLDDKIRIITTYPLGKRTISKYHKKRFINSRS